MMKAYVIRFKHPEHGSVFGEVVAGTEADAREEFERLHPDWEITSSHEKQYNHKFAEPSKIAKQ